MEFIEDIKEEEYTNFVIKHKYSHFLKSYEWGQIAKERGFKPYYVGLKENDVLLATALLLKKTLPFGFTYFYIPRGYTIDYNDYQLIEIFTKHIKDFTKKHKSMYFKIDPDIYLHKIDSEARPIDNGDNNYKLVEELKKIGFKHLKLTKFFETEQPRFTFRIDIDKDISDIRKAYSKSVIRWIKQANKYGVKTNVGNADNVSDFVRLTKMTEKRQNFFSHDYDFYKKFYDLFNPKGYLDVLYASVDVNYVLKTIDEELNKIKDTNDEHKNKLLTMKNEFSKLDKSKPNIVSSYFNINYGDKSWYLYGANDMDYKLVYPNYKLFDFQIEYGQKKGMKIFDEFGTVGDVHTNKSVGGLHEFKKKFGGEYLEFIGEFDYITNKFMYFIFTKLVPIYRKVISKIKHKQVKNQKIN